jgi:divalent metal cation (Fe/Co/Zn/Cd) transporter
VHDRELEVTTADSVRAGLVASFVSICWTACASAATITLGLISGSVVLVAFGGVGVFDAAGSAALVMHFRHALRHQSISRDRERFTQRIVVAGLLIVGVATTAASGVRLAERAHTHEPVGGIVVSAVSIAGLGFLADRKRRIARQIPSSALMADSWLSLAGCVTALFAVVGTALNATFGWWWIDPIAALCIALGAIAVALVNVRQLRVASAAGA